MIIRKSFKNGDGIKELREKIVELFSKGRIRENSETLLTNKRHYLQVVKCIGSIDSAIDAFKEKQPFDMAIICMNEAVSALGEITGDDCMSGIIDRIFSDFCVGK